MAVYAWKQLSTLINNNHVTRSCFYMQDTAHIEMKQFVNWRVNRHIDTPDVSTI